MVYDITEKAFPAKVEEGDFQNGHQPPLELNNVKEIITLGQLYNRDGFLSQKFWLELSFTKDY